MDRIIICLEDLVDSEVQVCSKCPSRVAAQWVVAAQANLYPKKQSSCKTLKFLFTFKLILLLTTPI